MPGHCATAFHPLCARNNGQHLATRGGPHRRPSRPPRLLRPPQRRATREGHWACHRHGGDSRRRHPCPRVERQRLKRQSWLQSLAFPQRRPARLASSSTTLPGQASQPRLTLKVTLLLSRGLSPTGSSQRSAEGGQDPAAPGPGERGRVRGPRGPRGRAQDPDPRPPGSSSRCGSWCSASTSARSSSVTVGLAASLTSPQA